MRAWLYDTLVGTPGIQTALAEGEGYRKRVMPRQSKNLIPKDKPFIIYGLGNATDEALSDSTSQEIDAERQFFQVWVHDEPGSYLLIDDLVEIIINRLRGASHKPSRILTVSYLETSGEFGNETYGTIFRYIRFQAVRTRGAVT